MSTYDSAEDTRQHIERVRGLLLEVQDRLNWRGIHHDTSKLIEPEVSIFDEYTPLLRESTYGSEEYKTYLSEMKVALDHHYASNSHHPEHYEDGIAGMSLLDLVEMLCDWKAATERHADGSITKSLEINRERFGISDQLASILENTAKELGWT